MAHLYGIVLFVGTKWLMGEESFWIPAAAVVAAAAHRGGQGTTRMTLAHPRHELDSLLTNPVRRSIDAARVDVERAEFALVRDSVEVTDSMLSKQAAQLEEAGDLQIDKGRVGRRPRTWLQLSADGVAVYRRHIRALQAIAQG